MTVNWVNLTFDNSAEKADCFGMVTSLFGEHGDNGFYDRYYFVFHINDSYIYEGMKPYEITAAEKEKNQLKCNYVIKKVGNLEENDFVKSDLYHIVTSNNGPQIYVLMEKLLNLAHPYLIMFAKGLNEHLKEYGEKLHLRKANSYFKKRMEMIKTYVLGQ